MKRTRCSLKNVCLIFLLWGGVSEARTFMLPDGRSIDAEIVKYHAKTGLVELSLANGKRKKVQPSIFVPADQSYIKEWASLSTFRDEKMLQVSADEKKVKTREEKVMGDVNYNDGDIQKEVVAEVEYTSYVFEVQLDNRSASPMENLEVHYCIYYEQLRAAGSGGAKRTQPVVDHKNVSGTFEKVSLIGKEKKALETKPVELHEKEYVTDANFRGGDPVKEKGKIQGVWLKIYASTASGEKVCRNLYSPESLRGKVVWKGKAE